MNIVIAHDLNDFARCIMIRTRVFVIEQNISAEIETDEWENGSTHYLATEEEKALATARWRLIDDQTAKIERVAVLKEARGQGVGTELMRYILQEIHSHRKIQTIKLGSQNSAIPFYEKLGFQVIGEEYLDAGIPHHLMFKNNADV
jgi:predicted GNAT family N-acyltransferase